MSDRRRLALLTILVGTGVVLTVTIARQRTETPLPPSLAPAFQLLGAPVQALDHLVTRVIPIDDLDERDFGAVLRSQYDGQTDTTDVDFRYVNQVMARIAGSATKPFDYRVYVLPHRSPNAMALPGGVVLVTTGLFDVLHSEAALASVLAHEMGHIERGHSMDAIKFRLLADKIGAVPFGELVDYAVQVLVSHTFSKAVEDDADEYAYAIIVQSVYDPHGMGAAFGSFLEYAAGVAPGPGRRSVDPIRDYILSHPPLELREAEFRERAAAWWRRNPNAVRTWGQDAYANRRPVGESP